MTAKPLRKGPQYIIIIIIIILGLCYHFSPFNGGSPPWIASTDVCLGPILSRWFPGADWGHLSILFSVFLVVLTISLGTQDVALMVHLLSWSLATWPAHRCFDCLMWSMMSVTPVCCQIQVLCLWSRRVMPSIILSIFLCATASASIWVVVNAQVSLPYVITGSTYSLNTFSLISMLALRLLMMLSTLLKAVHPNIDGHSIWSLEMSYNYRMLLKVAFIT